MKDRSDKFDSMFQEESEKIRLDEAGWKARCAAARVPVVPAHPHGKAGGGGGGRGTPPWAGAVGCGPDGG